MQGLFQGGQAVIPFEQIHHRTPEILGVHIEGLQTNPAKGAAHGLGVPQHLAGRPGQHAHRVVARLDQALIEAVLLQVGVGLEADKKDRWLHLVGAKDLLQGPVVGHGLANRFGAFVDDVERVVHRDVLAETRSRQQAAVLKHDAQVVAHAHLAHQLLGAGGDADLEIAHARGHHQLGQLGIEVVGADVGGPTDIAPTLGLDGA